MNKFPLDKKNQITNTYIPVQKRQHSRVSIVLLIILGLWSNQPAIADIQTTVLFQPPPEDEQPENTEGAASRHTGKCGIADLESQTGISARDYPHLTAIAPQANYGLTTAERPSFWVYIPETSAQQLILSIRQEDNTPHWQQSINLAGGGGIRRIRIAENAPALEIGKNYQWATVLVCGDRPNPNDPAVVAWVKRIEALPASNTDQSPKGFALAASYAQQGIWYDALNILIAERSASPSWQNVWMQYLQSGGLEKVANQPLIPN